MDELAKIVEEASIIKCKKEKIYVDHIKQFVINCPPKDKVDFLAKIFKHLVITQCIVFVNTRQYAEDLVKFLQELNLSIILISGKIEIEERD